MATLNELMEQTAKLLINYTNIFKSAFNLFYSTTPQDITIQIFDENGALQDYTIPNRAKDFNYIKNGQESPEATLVAVKGTLYQDLTNAQLYIKSSATGNTGWNRLLTEADLPL